MTAFLQFYWGETKVVAPVKRAGICHKKDEKELGFILEVEKIGTSNNVGWGKSLKGVKLLITLLLC